MVRKGRGRVMTTKLCAVEIASCYKTKRGEPCLLPKKMAQATPDMKGAIYAISEEVAQAGGRFQLSDLFRTYEMQLQANLDFVNKKKSAFSPPPGGSMHEAGRAFDVDLDALKLSLPAFWEIAARHGVVPIIAAPDPHAKECWHFERRGSHQAVYDYYKAQKANNMKPGQAMAASAILAISERVDQFGANQDEAFAQAALIRLGFDSGNIDGALGPKCRAALTQLGLSGEASALRAGLTDLLQTKFPEEYFDKAVEVDVPVATRPIPSPPPYVPPPASQPAPEAPQAPPPVAKKKPLEKSRSIWGALLAGVMGLAMALKEYSASAWTSLAQMLPFNPIWLLLGVLLLGVFMVIYARIDDRLKSAR